MKKNTTSFKDRQSVLTERRNLKMARSAHAYVRGSTVKFYEWLESSDRQKIPHGPAIWICGDCHVGNLGPVAGAAGKIDVQIRDLDQTVIGNPAHDLIRLGLSLATAARSSDLPGVTTAIMVEEMMEGYQHAFSNNKKHRHEKPESVQLVMQEAFKRSWKHLARERIEDTTPVIPLGKKFWPLSPQESKEVESLFSIAEISRLATSLKTRDDDANVKVLDAAYWMKGCSSLGRLRYAVLLKVGSEAAKNADNCLMDVKEAITAAAPTYPKAKMPKDNAHRVVEGARHLSPYLGERMLPAHFMGRSVFVRELLPQDLKIEMEELTCEEAVKAARFLAHVVGVAHARQMDKDTRSAWHNELKRDRTKTLDAPSWLWKSIIELMATHETAYLEHCRRYALKEIA